MNPPYPYFFLIVISMLKKGLGFFSTSPPQIGGNKNLLNSYISEEALYTLPQFLHAKSFLVTRFLTLLVLMAVPWMTMNLLT